MPENKKARNVTSSERRFSSSGRSKGNSNRRGDKRQGGRSNRKHDKGWVPRREHSDKARLVAYDVLRMVDEDDAYANLVLPREIRRARLNKLDAAYATNLCYGTLRLRGRWDAIISRCTQGRALENIDPELLDILRMGCQQLLGFGTPVHAAINETVKLARNEISQGAGGFVNAILRRVAERTDDWEDVIRSSTASEMEFLSVWYSHPRWVVEALAESLEANGRSLEELATLLEADNEPAKVALVARGISTEQLAQKIDAAHMECSESALMPSALLLDSGDPHRLWAVQDGEAGVQDEGSQLIAAVTAGVPLEGRDELWLDMCAGPGGKTATLASIAVERGARIHANEPQPHRLDLVAEAVEPWTDIVGLREGDGRDLGTEEAEQYDRVLVDAPCTGLGALRRRPEARWRKRADDVESLTKLQAELLNAGFDALRAGGVLVYSTCSPVIAETRDIVAGFLEKQSQAELVDAAPIATAQAKREVTSVGGMIQLWPDSDNTDAMFIAVIRKKND